MLTRGEEINNLRQEKVAAARARGQVGKWRHLTPALSTSNLIAGATLVCFGLVPVFLLRLLNLDTPMFAFKSF